MDNIKILFAPLQGFTDYYFRNAHQKIIGGIHEYYAPYLRLDNDKNLPKKQLKDIHPDQNASHVIPQLLVNNSTDFIYLANLLSDFGYQELNLNMGCPYPMVTNRILGSGLLNKPELVQEMLEQSLARINIKVSVKLRLGLDSPHEINTILPLLNQFDLTKVIIHPRIARKLYKGTADVDAFVKCQDLSKHKLVYNGDIVNEQTFNEVQSKLPNINEFMIGRGLLWDSFLALKLNGQTAEQPESYKSLLEQFHQEVFNIINENTSGFSHTHNKLLQFWTYFAYNFPEGKKLIKRVKKCKSESVYWALVGSVFNH